MQNRIKETIMKTNQDFTKLLKGDSISPEQIGDIVAKIEQSIVPVLDELGSMFITDRGEGLIGPAVQIQINNDNMKIDIGSEVTFKKS